VHGNETLGVLAAREFVNRIRGKLVAGCVAWAAPAHPDAWTAFERNSPVDDLNLARVFPGSPDGRPTERVAAYLTDNLIAGSDLLIDLHTSGPFNDMPLLCGYHSEGELSGRAAQAAAAFAATFTWQHPDASAGRSLSAAEALGIPSIYVESAGGGRVRRADMEAYVDGLSRVLAHYGMIDAAPDAPPTTVVVGDGNTDLGISSAHDGYFVTNVDAGDEVAQGHTLGWVFGEDSAILDEIRAPQSGYVMMLRMSAWVAVADTLALIGVPG
jgi:predicted deacylase